MTNNIVAHFSSSLWKPSESQRAASKGFNVGDFKEYRAVSGSVFNEEFNETLDSGTLVLSQVKKEDRLTKIKPYDFVRVFDKSGNTGFDKIFLVDNFDEKENNIKDHLFGYTVYLMSETKILEKIQCPNRVVTHDIFDGVVTKKTIYEHIKRCMELYVPKIKFSQDGQTWSYKPLIDIPKQYERITRTISVPFSASDFEPAEVAGYYVLEISSPEIEGEEFLFMEILGYTVESELSLTPHIQFNRETHKFDIYDDTTEVGSGTINITFAYSDYSAFFKRFNVPCADLSFTCPTLRQLLTVLMQQVGCIPTVKNRVLSFLDFQQEAVPFGYKNGYIDYSLGNTVNYIRRSLSSDSYVNTLANLSENVLDSENEVICETLGFRDRDNVLIKQKENLNLETSLPIYKVNKCVLNAPGRYIIPEGLTGYISSNQGCWTKLSYNDPHTICILYRYSDLIFENLPIIGGQAPNEITKMAQVVVFANLTWPYRKIHINDNKIYFLTRDNNGKYLVHSSQTFADFEMTTSNSDPYDNSLYDDGSYPNDDDYIYYRTFSFSGLNASIVGYFFSGVCYDGDQNENPIPFSFIKFDSNDQNVKYFELAGDLEVASEYADTAAIDLNNSNFAQINEFRKWDISKLVVENGARQLLDRDFVKMANETNDKKDWTLDVISKYVYGTVGYSIGSKQITGFSDVYNIGNSTILGWITKDYTYIENIVKVLVNSYSEQVPDKLSSFYQFLKYITPTTYIMASDIASPEGMSDRLSRALFLNIKYEYYSPLGVPYIGQYDNGDPYIYYKGEFGGQPFFSTFYVDLYYQPLNSFNMSYVKEDEDVPIPLVQYDGNASGLTDFDRLSIHEQEQVNRIGNETLSISQRAINYDDIQDFSNGPLVFRDDANRGSDNTIDYIIFKRSFTINNNCFNVSYVGSKAAVLKNYFTSIRTKYRAYQYVDYNSSVLRKEKDLLFVRIATDYYDGDDKIKWGNALNKEQGFEYIPYLMYDVFKSTSKRQICYELETDTAKVADGKSGYVTETETVKNSVSAICTKNTMAFVYEYMDNVGAGPYIKDLFVNQDIGGIPQYYQIWDDDYNEKHEVKFTNYIDFYSWIDTTSDEDIQEAIEKIGAVPIVDDTFTYSPIFYVMDDNSNDSDNKRTFYKDNAERINHTVQFIYYAPNNDVLFGEDFIAGAPLINRFDTEPERIIVTNDFYFDDNWHENRETEHNVGPLDPTAPNAIISILTNNRMPRIRVNWSQYNFSVVKLCRVGSDELGNMVFKDIVVFKRPSDNPEYTDFYFMLNDTKTDQVFAEKENILYLAYHVAKFTDSNENPVNVLARHCAEYTD